VLVSIPAGKGLDIAATSAPVSTPTTPGSSSAALASSPAIRACGTSERRIAAWRTFGTGSRSSMNLPSPRRSASSSNRRSARPTQVSVATVTVIAARQSEAGASARTRPRRSRRAGRRSRAPARGRRGAGYAGKPEGLAESSRSLLGTEARQTPCLDLVEQDGVGAVRQGRLEERRCQCDPVAPRALESRLHRLARRVARDENSVALEPVGKAVRTEVRIRAAVCTDLAVDDEKGAGRRLGVDREVGPNPTLLEGRSQRASGQIVTDPTDDGRVRAAGGRPDSGVRGRSACAQGDAGGVSSAGHRDVDHQVA